MVLWKFTFRELMTRPGRAALTLIGIVIGVASVVAVNLSTITTRHAYDEIFRSLAGRSDFEIVAEGGFINVPESLADQVAAVEGVDAVAPVCSRYTILDFKGRRLAAQILGIAPERDSKVRRYILEDGVSFENLRGALVEKSFAEGLGLSKGDTITILTHRLSQEIEVGGLFQFQDAEGLVQASGLIVLPLDAVQYYFRMPHKVSRIDVVLKPDVDETAAMTAIAGVTPQDLMVRIPSTRAQVGRDTIAGAEQGLNYSYALSLLLAVVLILNTFMINVSERRRQLAVLRALGTTRGEIMRMLLREGFFFGLVGTALGIAFGIAGAEILVRMSVDAQSAVTPHVIYTWQPFVMAIVLGPGLSVASAYIPARLAGKVTPLEGMRPVIQEDGAPISAWSTWTGVAMLSLSGFGLLGCGVGILPPGLTIPLGTFFVAGLVFLIPLILEPVTRLTAWILHPLFGAEGIFAQRQVLRRRTRTTLTIGVLYIAISTGIGLGMTIMNNVDEIRNWQRMTVSGDFFVRAAFPDATGKTVSMPDEIGERLHAVPGVEGVRSTSFLQGIPVRPGNAGSTPQRVMVIAQQPDPETGYAMLLKDGHDPAVVWAALGSGEVVIGEPVSTKLGVHVGDMLWFDTIEGERELRVAAIASEFMNSGMVVYCDFDAGREMFGIDGSDVFMIRTDPAQRDAVHERVKTLADQNRVMVYSFAQMRQRLDGMLNGIITCLWGLIGLGFVVAAFGIANTLTMNVLEQTRDLALLRVVAMTKKQVRKTVLAQAAILGTLGIGVGIGGGMVGCFTTNQVAPAVLGYSVTFHFRPELLLVAFIFALILTLIAAWIPAVRASKLNLLIALHYE